MSYTLNTSHALYADLVELIGVQGGALVSHLTSRTFTPDAGTSFGTGTFGEHFQSSTNGFNRKGATFSPAISINTLTYNNYCIFIAVNDLTATGGTASATGCMANSGADSARLTLSGSNLASGGADSTTTTGTATITSGAHSLCVVRTGETSHQLYTDGVADGSAGGRLNYNNSALAWNELMGRQGQGSIAGKLVWIALFKSNPTSGQILDLHNSLGANNAFGLVQSGAAETTLAGDGSSTSTGAAQLNENVTLSGDGRSTTAGEAALSIPAITTPILKNNPGTILASTVIPKVGIYKLSDLTLVLAFSNLTTNASGQLYIQDNALVAGVDYLVVTADAAGAAVGISKNTAA